MRGFPIGSTVYQQLTEVMSSWLGPGLVKALKAASWPQAGAAAASFMVLASRV
jgi:hypothetical protein